MSCRGGSGGWTTICADVSTVIILNLFSTRSVAAATCHLLYPDSWSNTCQLLCHSLSSLYQPPSDPLINLVSSWLTGRAGLLIRPVPSPDVNCATTSESISVLEKNILTRMLSHCSTIQLSVWEAARTSRHMILKKSCHMMIGFKGRLVSAVDQVITLYMSPISSALNGA